MTPRYRPSSPTSARTWSTHSTRSRRAHRAPRTRRASTSRRRSARTRCETATLSSPLFTKAHTKPNPSANPNHNPNPNHHPNPNQALISECNTLRKETRELRAALAAAKAEASANGRASSSLVGGGARRPGTPGSSASAGLLTTPAAAAVAGRGSRPGTASSVSSFQGARYGNSGGEKLPRGGYGRYGNSGGLPATGSQGQLLRGSAGALGRERARAAEMSLTLEVRARPPFVLRCPTPPTHGRVFFSPGSWAWALGHAPSFLPHPRARMLAGRRPAGRGAEERDTLTLSPTLSLSLTLSRAPTSRWRCRGARSSACASSSTRWWRAAAWWRRLLAVGRPMRARRPSGRTRVRSSRRRWRRAPRRLRAPRRRRCADDLAAGVWVSGCGGGRHSCAVALQCCALILYQERSRSS